MSLAGLCFMMSPLPLGLVAYWLMPRVDWSARVGAVLLGLGALLWGIGFAWDAGSGVALYPDRVVRREAGFDMPMSSDAFARIWRVEASCNYGRRRQPEPSYVLWFVDGRPVDIWGDSRIFINRERSVKIFNAVRQADVVINRIGAVRAPQRRADGMTLGSAGCVTRLAEQLGMTRDDVEPLFVVHQSQLRPEEYRVAP